MAWLDLVALVVGVIILTVNLLAGELKSSPIEGMALTPARGHSLINTYTNDHSEVVSPAKAVRTPQVIIPTRWKPRNGPRTSRMF